MKQSHVAERIGYLLLLPALTILLWIRTVPAWICTGLLIGYVLFNEIRLLIAAKKKKNLARSVVDVLNMTSQKRLIDFPVPIVIADATGAVIWYNDAFTSSVSESALSGLRHVSQMSADLPSSRVTDLKFDGRYYTAYMDRYGADEKSELFVFYLFDVTAHRALRREYELSRPVVAYLLVDNYDEIFSGRKESERTAGMAAIDELVNAWAQTSGGILCHAERERYLFVFEQRALTEFRNSRFDVMDRVRAVQTESRLFPTLSIGIGHGGKTFAENEESARAALDMALSRGGDQTVLRGNDGFSFFGARSQSGDRRTQIRTRVLANALNEQLKEISSMLILGHTYGDMDCLGAAVGMARIAKVHSIDAKIVIDETTDLTGNLLRDLKQDRDLSDLFLNRKEAEEWLTPETAVVVLDTHKAENTVAPSIVKNAKKVIVIDHHRKGVDSIADPVLAYQEPSVSSACEIITELFRYMNVYRISESEANALLAGIFLDTKNYTVRTNPGTFEASSFLRKQGANTVKVEEYFQTDVETYQEKARIIAAADIYRENFAIACRNGEGRGNAKIAAAQAADEMLNIEGVRASFTLFSDRNGNVNISGRSRGAINVQVILEKFGNGGGHQTMAGAFVRDTTLEAAREQLADFIDAYLEENADRPEA